MPSLISHLRTSQGVRHDNDEKIRLLVSYYPDGVAGKISDGPFLTVSDGDPVCRVLEGEFATDAGFAVKRVFLLVQKDEYSVRGDDIWPIVNEDIDKCWHRALKACADGVSAAPCLFFRDQLGEDGRFLRYQPLFMCAHRRIFFHPPCPDCGRSLALCEDDDLLVKNGLEAYSTSLSRYLFCENCAGKSEEAPFFAKKRKPSDPGNVRDQSGLTASYAGFLQKGAPSQLPCSGCEHAGECFQTGGLAETRLAAFSFYPFYMMVFDAPSLNGADFLSLLSGAPAGRVLENLRKRGEFGRQRVLENLPLEKGRFLFENDKRFFYEILYLKLSFLGDFAKDLFKNIHSRKYPDMRLSMEGIWVKLHQENAMLPSFWNFSLLSLDIGGNVPDSAYTPRLPVFFSLYGLGVVWFHALLVNRDQAAVSVQKKVSGETERMADDENYTFGLFADRDDPEFGPENIFWAPGEMAPLVFGPAEGDRNFQDEARSIWRRALELGWSLIKAGMDGKSDWSEEAFFVRLENLRDDVRGRLLVGAPAPAVAAADLRVSNDPAIAKILARIADKWRRNLEAPDDGFLRIEPEEETSELDLQALDEDETDTVILDPGASPAGQFDALEPEEEDLGFRLEDDEEDLPGTMVLSPDGARDFRNEPGRDGPLSEEGPLSRDLGMDLDREEDDESEADTVMLSARSFDGRDGRGPSPVQEAESGPEEIFSMDRDDDRDDDDDLVKTVMLSPEGGKTPGPENRDATLESFSGGERLDGNDAEQDEEDEDEDDFLSETVFLSTGKYTFDDNEGFRPADGREKNDAAGREDKKSGPSDDDDDDDDLAATIILDPKK